MVNYFLVCYCIEVRHTHEIFFSKSSAARMKKHFIITEDIIFCTTIHCQTILLGNCIESICVKYPESKLLRMYSVDSKGRFGNAIRIFLILEASIYPAITTYTRWIVYCLSPYNVMKMFKTLYRHLSACH